MSIKRTSSAQTRPLKDGLYTLDDYSSSTKMKDKKVRGFLFRTKQRNLQIITLW
jgi:hypothetical protein